MNHLQELKIYWSGLTRDEKIDFVESNSVEVHERGEGSWSPRHPITQSPSRETFRNKHDAAIEQIDWLMSMID